MTNTELRLLRRFCDAGYTLADAWGATKAHVEAAARELAGNWRRFENFGWGDRPAHRPEDVALVYLTHRDSDPLDESNAAAILRALAPFTGQIADGATVEECSHGHWGVGYVDGIVIRVYDSHGQITDAFRTLYDLTQRLADYPVLDEEDYSRREEEAADEMWRSCYTPSERIAYIRANRDQCRFEFFRDVLSAVRGRYFPGYASEFLAR